MIRNKQKQPQQQYRQCIRENGNMTRGKKMDEKENRIQARWALKKIQSINFGTIIAVHCGNLCYGYLLFFLYLVHTTYGLAHCNRMMNTIFIYFGQIFFLHFLCIEFTNEIIDLGLRAYLSRIWWINPFILSGFKWKNYS